MDNKKIEILKYLDERVSQVLYQGKKCYMKKHVPSKRNYFHQFQKLLFWITRSPFWVNTILKCGRSEIIHEAQKLKLLKQLGVNVPTVLECNEEYLIIEDCGQSLVEILKEDPQNSQDYLDKAISSLAILHQAHQCHGGAQIRNFTINHGEIYMIDFEEDIPHEYFHGIAFRDLILFMMSIPACVLPNCSISRLVKLYEEHSQIMVRKRLNKFARRLNFLKFLSKKPFSKWVGKDVLIMNTIIEKVRQQL